VQRHYEEFRRLGAEVQVVTQARPDLLAAFLREQPLPFPAVADPERTAYRAFGLERASWATLLRPGVVLRYLRLLFRGWRPRPVREGEDVLQLGGDFVLDGEGRLVYAYRSAEPTDRPAVEALLQAVRDIALPATPPAAGARAE
jgi:AhpC/TSA antioxidant enzyme